MGRWNWTWILFLYTMDDGVKCSIVIEFKSCEKPFGMMWIRIVIMMMREMIGIKVAEATREMMMIAITRSRVENVIMMMTKVIANILD